MRVLKGGIVQEPKRERVFSLHITAKDIAIICLSSFLGIYVIGILVTHDIAFGIMVALSSAIWTLATRCLTYNPHKYVNNAQWDEECIEYDKVPRVDRLLRGVMNIIMLFFGLLMVDRSALIRISSDGEHHKIVDFSESPHIETAGWILVSLSLYLLISPLVYWAKDKIKGRIR